MSRLQRQTFLGAQSDVLLHAATVGVVGVGGGGSHVVQQFAHIGIGGYVLPDPDSIEDTNTNRLVGGTLADVKNAMPKVAIAERVVRGLQPNARIFAVKASWAHAANILKTCDVIVGALDSFKEREQLERFARRYLIPYVDIGMDVTPLGEDSFLVSGQVILSTPGRPCLRCCGLITDDRLKREAEEYGSAGPRPQVVWPNGVLASTAVGIVIQLITPWFSKPPEFVYLEYDGNKATLTQSNRTDGLKGRVCSHHPNDETGDPLFDIRRHLDEIEKREKDALRSRWRSWLSRILRYFT